MPKVAPVSRRKADHIQINLEKDVASARTTGLERLRFDNAALPELDLHGVRTELSFLGRILLALVFGVAGIAKLLDFQGSPTRWLHPARPPPRQAGGGEDFVN